MMSSMKSRDVLQNSTICLPFFYYLCKTATISCDARTHRAILVKFYVIISRLWYQNGEEKSVRILGKKFSFNFICLATSILHSRQNKQIRQLTKDSVIEQKKNFFPQPFYNDNLFYDEKNLDYSNGDETSICSGELRNTLPETKEEWVPQKKK